MTLSNELLELLVCPQCKKPIQYDPKNNRILCEACHLSYPVRDGIPVMLLDEAVQIKGSSD